MKQATGFFALLIALAAAIPAVAQEEPSGIFVERVVVTVVNLEVFVTDPDGRLVAGLTPEDFEIYEDGEPVEITNFFAVTREDRVLRSLETGSLTAETVPKPAPSLLPEEHRLNLLVYVDHFNLRPGNRERLLEDLEDFLQDRLAQGDNIMLMGAFRTPKVVVPFTRDRQAIADGIKKLKKAATHRQVDETLLQQQLRSMQISADDGDVATAYSFVRSYVQSTSSDLRVSSRAIQQTVRSLSGLPGRKAFLYISEGLPQRPGEELYQQLFDQFGQVGLQSIRIGGTPIDPSIEAIAEDQSQLFNEVAREANANQVTFYTLDASGGEASRGLTASFNRRVGGAGGPTTFGALRKHNLQQPLIDLAEATGGASTLNTFNFGDALVRIADDFDGFYSLGYTPQTSGDGKYHHIEVRVKHPALRVRHRTGYLDKPPEERVADRTIASLAFELEKNPLEVSIDFGEAERIKKGRYNLPLLIRIPIRGMALIPGEQKEEGRLEIYVGIKDDEGRTSDLHRATYPVEVPNELAGQAQGMDVGYTVTLAVRPGLAKVAVGVWDAISGLESFVHKSVRVGDQG